ncbi:MAG: hypothetical protein IPN39_09760 [Chitinophagaceae bacterium]|nr:hypothetical protein [Chitinophagaceae bacterium]
MSTDNVNTGKVGDFVIYSLPKYFPVQFGGIIKGNKNFLPESDLEHDAIKYLNVITDYHLKNESFIRMQRMANYNLYVNLFSSIGFHPHFEMTKDVIPGVFMFNTFGINNVSLKIYMQENGIESSVFYGREAFFVPVNQSLTEQHIKFIFTLVQNFIYDNV